MTPVQQRPGPSSSLATSYRQRTGANLRRIGTIGSDGQPKRAMAPAVVAASVPPEPDLDDLVTLPGWTTAFNTLGSRFLPHE